MTTRRLTVREIYEGSDGDATAAFYAELGTLGPIGYVAVNVFRAQKCSDRAKKYPSGHYSSLAYGRKNWSMDQLTDVLVEHGAALGVRFGWGHDVETPKYPWVLYVDLPTGQISFHAPVKGNGPMYAGTWDGTKDASTERILQFVESIAEPSIVKERHSEAIGEAETTSITPAAKAPALRSPKSLVQKLRRQSARRPRVGQKKTVKRRRATK